MVIQICKDHFCFHVKIHYPTNYPTKYPILASGGRLEDLILCSRMCPYLPIFLRIEAFSSLTGNGYLSWFFQLSGISSRSCRHGYYCINFGCEWSLSHILLFWSSPLRLQSWVLLVPTVSKISYRDYWVYV